MTLAAIPVERTLSGPEKAAALLLMMGKPPAARLLKQFETPDLRVLARAAAGLGAVPASTLDRVVEEFSADFLAGADLLGDLDQARNLLAEALPANEVEDLLDSLSRQEMVDVWEALARIPEHQIIAFLEAERPATATYVLSKLDPPLAARIVSSLPRERRNAALCGLMAPQEVTPLAANLVESALHQLLKAPKAASGGPADGRSRIAGIINNLDPEAAEDVMRAIGEARPEEAAILKTMLFTFNDLPKLSERARALLFDRTSIDIVVMALRGTDTEFRNAVLSSMPSRGRRLVEGELSAGAPAPQRDIAKARKTIADIVLGMASRNEIELGGVSDEAA